MAGMMGNIANLFSNPNFIGTLFGIGQMMDQQAHQQNVAQAVGNAQNQVLQNGGSFLDAQRAGAFLQANSPYQMPLMGVLGQGLLGYQQNQQSAAANAAMMQLMLMGMGDGEIMKSPQAQALMRAAGLPGWNVSAPNKTTMGFGNYPKVPNMKHGDKVVTSYSTNDPNTNEKRNYQETVTIDNASQTSYAPAVQPESLTAGNDMGKRLKRILTDGYDPYDQYSR